MNAINYAHTLNTSRPGARKRGRIGLVLFGVIVCLGCTWMGVQAARPFLLASRLRHENDDLERQMLRYRIQNQRAELQVKGLQTREGIIRAAREHGMVMPGEQRLRVPQHLLTAP